MEKTVRKLQYQLGDAMGDFAPDFLQRRSSIIGGLSGGLIIGLGSIAVAAGIGFLALRIADRRLSEVIQSVIPRYSSTNGKHRTVHGTSGAEMPDVDRIESRRGRMERQFQGAEERGGMPL